MACNEDTALKETAQPGISLSAEELDFGEVWADEELKKTVQVTNTGKTALAVDAVQATCRCIKASLSQTALPAGESADLTVELLLEDYSVDDVRGKVILRGGVPPNDMKELPICAKIRPEFTVEPPKLDFGKVKRGRFPVQSLVIRQAGHQEMVLQGVETPKELIASMTAPDSGSGAGKKEGEEPVAAPAKPEHEKSAGSPNTSPSNALKSSIVQVTISPEAPNGKVNTRLFLLTDVKRKPKCPVRVTAEIVGVECTITPRVVVFGPDQPGATVGALDVVGVQDIQVLDASSTTPDLVLGIEEVEPGKRCRVAVALRKDAAPGDKVGRIHLTLKEGALVETRDIPFYGTVAAEQ